MRKVGSGITVHTKPDMVPATSENVIAFFEGINRKMHEPWGGLAEVIQFARRRFEQIKAQAPSVFDDLEGYNRFFVERESEGWYVHGIVIEAQIAERAVAEGRPWEAVACAMRIGELLTELRMKELWEGPAIVGQKILRARAESREDANTRRHLARSAEWASWNAKAQELWKLHPDWGAPAVAARVKADLGLTDKVDTIRKRLKRAGTAG